MNCKNMDVIDSIEKFDLSARNSHFRQETCKTIILGLSEITQENRICERVKEAYQSINIEDQRQVEIRWWLEAFHTYKNLWISIKNKSAETDLIENDRIANLKLLEAILFSARLSILVLTTDSECDLCSAESISQLINLVKFIRQLKNPSQ